MASWNFTTSGAAIAKAGAGANTDVIASVATLAKWSDDVEGTINSRTRIDWITNPPTANFAGFLSELAATKIAYNIVDYDLDGYGSTAKGQTKLNTLDNDFEKMIGELRKQEIKEKMV